MDLLKYCRSALERRRLIGRMTRSDRLTSRGAAAASTRARSCRKSSRDRSGSRLIVGLQELDALRAAEIAGLLGLLQHAEGMAAARFGERLLVD